MATHVTQYPNALRACIKQAGYSFREVSRETAIPESTLYDWAAGNRVIPHQERQILARLLGCDVELLAPNSSSSFDTSNLVIYSQGLPRSLMQQQQGNGMDQRRRLIAQAMAAAGIAAQGHLLSYIVASNREDFKEALAHCQQARTYAQIAHDRNLEAVALMRQGVVGLHRKRPYHTLQVYEEALQFVDAVSSLIRTRLYASLGEVQGKLGMEQAARRSIGLAQEHFPDQPAKDPAVLYIHFSQAGLYLHEGLALLDVHKPQEALDALLHIDGLHPKMDISERSRIDVLNQQARAAGDKGDLEQFKLYLESAVTSALKLGFELRYSEAWDTYQHVHDLWRHEPQVQSLTGLFEKQIPLRP